MTGDVFSKRAELACLDPEASFYAGEWDAGDWGRNGRIQWCVLTIQLTFQHLFVRHRR